MKIEEWPIERLKPYARNPRKNSHVVDKMKASIVEFGFRIPPLVKPDGEIVDGHLRVLAAIELGMKTIPVIPTDGLSDAQIKAFRIMANKSVEWAEWDRDFLAGEMLDLQSIGFDLSFTGFDGFELEDLMRGGASSMRDPEATPEPPADPVSRIGDIWLCGAHRVMAGSALDATHIAVLLAGHTPAFANCDPPYGLKIVRNAGASVGGAKAFGASIGGYQHTAKNELSRRGSVHSPGKDGLGRGRGHGPAKRAIIMPGLYQPIIGDDTIETAVAAHAVLVGLGIPIIVLWGGNYYANRVPASRCWLVWDKENSGSFADAELAWTNQDRVVKVFRHQWNGLIKASERGEKRTHPTQKPVALAEWVHQTVAPKAKTVLDLFLGSGPVLIAAERAGIQCFGMELSLPYVDVAVTRWANLTDADPTLEATGQTFAEVKAARSKKPRLPRKARPVAVVEAEPVQPAEIL